MPHYDPDVVAAMLDSVTEDELEAFRYYMGASVYATYLFLFRPFS